MALKARVLIALGSLIQVWHRRAMRASPVVHAHAPVLPHAQARTVARELLRHATDRGYNQRTDADTMLLSDADMDAETLAQCIARYEDVLIAVRWLPVTVASRRPALTCRHYRVPWCTLRMRCWATQPGDSALHSRLQSFPAEAVPSEPSQAQAQAHRGCDTIGEDEEQRSIGGASAACAASTAAPMSASTENSADLSDDGAAAVVEHEAQHSDRDSGQAEAGPADQEESSRYDRDVDADALSSEYDEAEGTDMDRGEGFNAHSSSSGGNRADDDNGDSLDAPAGGSLLGGYSDDPISRAINAVHVVHEFDHDYDYDDDDDGDDDDGGGDEDEGDPSDNEDGHGTDVSSSADSNPQGHAQDGGYNTRVHDALSPLPLDALPENAKDGTVSFRTPFYSGHANIMVRMPCRRACHDQRRTKAS